MHAIRWFTPTWCHSRTIYSCWNCTNQNKFICVPSRQEKGRSWLRILLAVLQRFHAHSFCKMRMVASYTSAQRRKTKAEPSILGSVGTLETTFSELYINTRNCRLGWILRNWCRQCSKMITWSKSFKSLRNSPSPVQYSEKNTREPIA